ncbi:hypothetical protein LSTR_LSTR016775 [Laodelphax striatellus]|uniref:Uncharacterized protein n=1 Tax=Laodelphax striatellus TaxID=195883 RepID=A0A482WP75_LAOST|nr:hypothetical protein LSTR_LSTR016775 [Laodelphax striatellus]
MVLKLHEILLLAIAARPLNVDYLSDRCRTLNHNPQYQFSFDIKDDESTNYHNRKETRDGDKISGSYSVVDSDGFIRTVTYTADPKEVPAFRHRQGILLS